MRVNRAVWLVVLLSAVPALAIEEVPPPRFALSATTASLVSISSSVLGGVLALSIPSFCTAQFGAPRPMCGVGGLALAGATQLLISWLVLPEVFRISGIDPSEVRASWWRWARWPAALLAVSVLVFLAGSSAEQSTYASGQGTMLTGLGGAAASGITLDVLGVIGAVRSARGIR